jgi:hypothetical protein
MSTEVIAQNTVEETENTEVQMQVVEPKITPQVASMWNNTKMFNLAYKLAGFLGQSDLVPQNYQGKVANCLIAIDIANRMGISPMAVMQNSQVVRGRFSWTGSACKSMIDGCGKYRKPTVYREVGKKGEDSWGFYLEGETKDGEIVKGVEVTVSMAKAEGWYAQNPKWRNMTELMLKYRCAAFFMRTECAGLAMGFLTAEENEDIIPEAPKQNLSELLDKETN